LLAIPPVPPAVDEGTTSERGSSADDSTDDEHEMVLALEMQLQAKLQDPKVVAALASYCHTGDGGKARGRKDTSKGGGQRPRGGPRASSSATSAPKTGKASIQFFCGKRDMTPAPRACSTQSAANARPAVVQHIEETLSHAAAQARQQGVSGRFWCPLCQSVQDLQAIPHSGHECQSCCEFIDVDQ
jgi:hypothetical protein